jgi:hypothetical protein
MLPGQHSLLNCNCGKSGEEKDYGINLYCRDARDSKKFRFSAQLFTLAIAWIHMPMIIKAGVA